MNMNTLNYDNYLTSDFEKAEEEAFIIEQAREDFAQELIDSGYSERDASLKVQFLDDNAIRHWIINNKEEQY